MKPTCDKCRFWNELDPDGEGVQADGNYEVTDFGTGQCRFNPPAGVRDVDLAKVGADSGDAASNALWPITWASDWCGRHAPSNDPEDEEQAIRRVIPGLGGVGKE